MFLGEAAHISITSLQQNEATRAITAPLASRQGLGAISYEQALSLSCRTQQIWKDEVE